MFILFICSSKLLMLSVNIIAPSAYSDSHVGIVKAFPKGFFSAMIEYVDRMQRLDECWLYSRWSYLNSSCFVPVKVRDNSEISVIHSRVYQNLLLSSSVLYLIERILLDNKTVTNITIHILRAQEQYLPYLTLTEVLCTLQGICTQILYMWVCSILNKQSYIVFRT